MTCQLKPLDNVQTSMIQIVENCHAGWDHILTPLIQLAFQLIEQTPLLTSKDDLVYI
jgi:hypothetical protein